MPELPVLEPSGAVDIGGNIPRIPKRLPISEAMSSGFSDIETQVTELAKGIRAQQIRQADADATINFTAKTNALRKSIDEEPDLDKQVKMWNDGLNQIRTDFRAQAPQLGTLTVQSIADKLSNEDLQFTAHNVEQKYKKGLADTHRTLDDNKWLILESEDPKEQERLKAQALAFVDKTRKGGFLDGPTAQDLKDKFLTDVRIGQFAMLAYKYPEKAVQKRIGDVHIPVEKFITIQNGAKKDLEQKQEQGGKDFKIKHDQALEYAMTHPEAVQTMVSNHAISPEEGSRIAGGDVYVHPPNDAAVTMFENDLQDFQGSDHDYDQHWIRDIMPHLHDMNIEDRRQIQATYTRHREERKSAAVQQSIEIKGDIKDRMYNNDMEHMVYAIPFLSKIFGPFERNLMNDLNTDLKNAKTDADRQKAKEKAIKTMEDFWTKNLSYGTPKPAAEGKIPEPEKKPDTGLRAD